MHEIDRHDRAILQALQENAEITNAALAERVNLSASQCSRRKAALEAAGLIEGYTARLSAKALGLGFRAMIRVNLNRHDRDTDAAFARWLETQTAVNRAYSVSGDADYIIEVMVADLEAFSTFVHGALLPHPTVGQVRSEIVLRTLKERTSLPVG